MLPSFFVGQMTTSHKKRQWTFSLVYLVWTALILWAIESWTATPQPKMDRQYQRVSHLLEERRDQLERIVGQLIKKETLERPKLEALLAPAAAETTKSG